ncbi:hypothetical protein [Baekduia sp. Peel2402]|uniref:hypothetical protein n=1 Tax=Baekduia sp. Peel2402 TaxID=3458296 RepID=UPI00403E90C4
MSESPTGDPATDLEREADRLEHHLEQLDDHIQDAHKAAAARREEATPDAAGDWDDTRGTPGQGEDPKGAVDETTEAKAHDASSEGDDATDSDDAETEGSASSESSGSADDATSGSGERTDPVGSRMPGHASGGDD